MNLLKDAKVIAALILAIGIAAGAWFLRSGVVAMAERGRNVTVKGLAVREVDADQVYWPIVFKEVGNDLPTLHKRINNVNQIIVKFLKDGGLTDEEISEYTYTPGEGNKANLRYHVKYRLNPEKLSAFTGKNVITDITLDVIGDTRET